MLIYVMYFSKSHFSSFICFIGCMSRISGKTVTFWLNYSNLLWGPLFIQTQCIRELHRKSNLSPSPTVPAAFVPIPTISVTIPLPITLISSLPPSPDHGKHATEIQLHVYGINRILHILKSQQTKCKKCKSL